MVQFGKNLRRRRSLIPAQGSSVARTLGMSADRFKNPEKDSPIAEPFQGSIDF
jgi:hypothetical protein